MGPWDLSDSGVGGGQVVYHVPMGLDAKGMTWFKTRGTGTNCVESYHSQVPCPPEPYTLNREP